MLQQIKAHQFYTNFLVLISPFSRLGISEVEFKHLDQYFSLEVLEFYSYLPVWTLNIGSDMTFRV